MARRAFRHYAVLSAQEAGQIVSVHDRVGNPVALP
jgi:hypothetical protein